MNDSMAQPGNALAPLELSGWKHGVSWLAAVAISLLFLVAGLWEITDPTEAAVRMAQARVPQALSLPAALLLGIGNTFTGVLILVPRFRRWGAWLAAALLLIFMAYFALNYATLRGEECTCFPWVKRVVGPGFFVGDGVMLVLAVLAGLWSKRSDGRRGAAVVLGAVVVFGLVSWGVAAARQTGVKAPETITVEGKPYSLQQGKIFIYFFDPECMHCIDAAKRMSKLSWGDTHVVGVPIQQPQFAQGFLQDTGLRAVISNDLALLRKTFPFTAAPAGVALENGREKAALTQFDGDEPAATLKKLALVY